MDTDDLNHFDELEVILEEVGVNKSNICLTGSAPLTVYGVRENGDIDFLATEETRSKMIDYAQQDPDYEVREDGKIKFSKDVEMSRPDRYDTVWLDDSTIINNDNYHFVLDGYKILRPEVALAIKGAERRPKDKKDIELIENSDITESEEWDWDRVTLVPPWERPDTGNPDSLFGRGLKSLSEDGFVTTSIKATRLIASKTLPVNTVNKEQTSGFRETYERGRLYTPPVTEDLCYPLPNLISRQYDDEGNFIRDDMVAAILSEEGNEHVEDEINLPEDSDEAGVAVSSDGRMRSGMWQVARKVVNYSDELPRLGSDLSFPVDIIRTDSDSGVSFDTVDAVEEANKKTTRAIEQRRHELLRQSGASFYAILWTPLQEDFDAAEEVVRSELSVFGSEEYRIEHGFEEFVRDLYTADKRNEDWFRETKLNELKKHDPVIRVLYLEVPDPSFRISKGHPVAEETHGIKMEFRRRFQDMFDDYMYGTDIHMTDNFRHNVHVGHMLTRVVDGRYNKLHSEKIEA